MHIFKNTNFDFLRWRWHAVALSWVVILAGLVVIAHQGPAARHRVRRRHGGDHAVRPGRVGRAGPRRARARRSAARTSSSSPTAIPAQHQVLMPRAAGRRRDRATRSAQTKDAVTDALKAGEPRQLHHRRHRDRQPDGRPGADEQGHLGDGPVARRHPGLHRVPLPAQLRGRRGRRDGARPAGDARVPGVLPVRPDAERDRRDPDGHRLLDQRHDRHLRPRAREPARHAARFAEPRHQPRRSTRRSAGRC